jgi:serine/threonine-protein kinase
VAVFAALGWWLASGRYTTVPQVSGLPVAAATAELHNAGLSVSARKTETSDSVAKGQVAGTSPAAGASVASGGHVTLLISVGPKMIMMPQVTGQNLSAAEAALRRAGLTPGTVTHQAAQSLPAGLVISTQPVAGTSWPQSKPVGIVVSAGPPVPNFVGQPLSAAQTWASQNGVRLVPLTGPSSQPSGNIFKQSVAPGGPFTRGQVIQVTVSSGPPMVNVPNVDGMKLGNAIFELHKDGFQVQVDKFGPFDTVDHYSPNGQAPQGSTITIFTGPSFGGGGNSGN